MTFTERPSLEDVLNAFAVEDRSNANVLVQFLREYPEYAEELVDLSREIHRTILEDDAALSVQDRARIEIAWQRYTRGVTAAGADPLARLSVGDLREMATALGVKRQVLAAFREHRVLVDSVPKRFLSQLAAAAKTTVEQLGHMLSVPVTLSPARSYKADSRPEDGGPVTFERLLIDAGHSDEERSALMSGDE